ncbi:hypothetical protein ACQ4LE_005210 [Meloidogyne hapla]
MEINENIYLFDKKLKIINKKMDENTLKYEELKEELKQSFDETKIIEYSTLTFDVYYSYKEYSETLINAKNYIRENKSLNNNKQIITIPKIKSAIPKKEEIQELIKNREKLENEWIKINKLKNPIDKFIEKAKNLLNKIKKINENDEIFLKYKQKTAFEKHLEIINLENEKKEEDSESEVSCFETPCYQFETPKLSDDETPKSAQNYEKLEIIHLFNDNPEDKNFFTSFLFQIQNKPTIIYLIYQYEQKIKNKEIQIKFNNRKLLRECRKIAMKKLNEQYGKKQIYWNINFISIGLKAYQIEIKNKINKKREIIENDKKFYNILLEENFIFTDGNIVENEEEEEMNTSEEN